MLGAKVSRRVESGSFVDIGHSLIIYVISNLNILERLPSPKLNFNRIGS